MNIIKRLDNVLTEVAYKSDVKGPLKPTIINIADQSDRVTALDNCRGPCIGWEDYAAGLDYEPPKFFNSDVPYGPRDSGKDGIVSTNKDKDQIKFKGTNDYSYKYGHVRPWAPGEVLMTMVSKGDGRNGTEGIISLISKKGAVTRTAVATRGKYDQTDQLDSMQNGAIAAIQGLPDDQARKDIRFTSWIGIAIQQGMIGGVPPGYGDEYRLARGLRRRLESIIKDAIDKARNGESLNQNKEDIINACLPLTQCHKCKGIGKVRENKDDPKSELVECPLCNGEKELKPGVKNRYGFIASTLIKIKNMLLRAIATKSAKNLQLGLETMIQVFDGIKEEEEAKHLPGVATAGQVGRKPRDEGTLLNYNKAADIFEQQRNIAKIAANLLSNGEHLHDLLVEATALYKPSGDYDKKLKKLFFNQQPSASNITKDSPKITGFVGFKQMTDKLLKLLETEDYNGLKNYIEFSNYEQDKLKHQERTIATSIGATGLTKRSKNSEKEMERTNFVRDDDNTKIQEIRDDAAVIIGLISPWKGRDQKQEKAAKETIDLLSDLDSYIKSYVELRANNGDTTKIEDKFSELGHSLSSDLGEYREEIILILSSIADSIKQDGGFADIRGEINDLKKVANQDVKFELSHDTVTPIQYRLLLRYFGISNYPERGTANDPEIDEHGENSKWAAAGYPSVGIKTPGKDSNVYLWTDIYERLDPITGKPECSVSNVRMTHQKNSALAKFKNAVEKEKEKIIEGLEPDMIDYQILDEFQSVLRCIIIEEVLPGGMELIYG